METRRAAAAAQEAHQRVQSAPVAFQTARIIDQPVTPNHLFDPRHRDSTRGGLQSASVGIAPQGQPTSE